MGHLLVVGGELTLLIVGTAAIAAVIALRGAGSRRTQALRRRWGAFTCDVVVAGAASPGIAQFGSETLQWWRRHSLASRPSRSWSRSELTMIERSPLGLGEDVTVRMLHDGVVVELVMSSSAYAGLTSWLEATPAVLTGVS